jgi:sugar lactone lactonase YvrE
VKQVFPILAAVVSVLIAHGTSAQSIYTPYAFTNFVGQPGVEGWADGAQNSGRLHIPQSVAVDQSGNLFISDTFNHAIRKVSPAGVMTTIAGTPQNKGYGDGVGFAEAASFNSPIGISSDPTGNLYVSDNGNQTIRKITPDGLVTLFAGRTGIKGNSDGLALNATFNSPHSTIMDSHGNIFVSDGVNRVIRKITPDGAVALFAGTFNQQGTNDGIGTAARFQQPMGLAIDKSDNLYVADENANTIRKITPGGVVTTLAGKGKSSGTQDGTGGEARFTGPEDLAVDASGTVYVCDRGNHAIRRVTQNGVVTTIAGVAGQRGAADGTNDTARFDAPRGIFIDRDGIIFVADSGNSAIRKLVIDGANCIVTTFAGTMGENGSVDGTGPAARFHFPYGITSDPSGNLYTVDRSNDDVRKITPEGVVTTFAGIAGIQGSADGKGAAAQFYEPEELALDGQGNIFVVEHANNTVRKIAPNGTNWVITTVAGCATCDPGTNDGPGLEARFDGPFGLTLSQGNIFVADTGNKNIRKLTETAGGWEVSTFAGNIKIPGVVDGSGTAATFSAPLGLAADSAGNIYVGDSILIRKITPDGTVSTLAGKFALGSADGPGSEATFSGARGLAVDKQGNIYVADQPDQLVRKLSPNGASWTVTTVAGSPGIAGTADGVGADARFNQPTGVAVDAEGNLYVADSSGARVTKGVSPNKPAEVRFDTSAAGFSLSNGKVTLTLTSSASGSIILEESQNLQTWSPVLTNAVTASPVVLTVHSIPGRTRSSVSVSRPDLALENELDGFPLPTNKRISLTALVRLRRVLLISLKTVTHIRPAAVRTTWMRPAARTPMGGYSSWKYAHGEQEETRR